MILCSASPFTCHNQMQAQVYVIPIPPETPGFLHEEGNTFPPFQLCGKVALSNGAGSWHVIGWLISRSTLPKLISPRIAKLCKARSGGKPCLLSTDILIYKGGNITPLYKGIICMVKYNTPPSVMVCACCTCLWSFNMHYSAVNACFWHAKQN